MSTKKKCNPFKRMLFDLLEYIALPTALIAVLFGAVWLQMTIIFSAFTDVVELKRFYGNGPYDYMIYEEPTSFAYLCQYICWLELVVIALLIIYAWYASAKKRCGK